MVKLFDQHGNLIVKGVGNLGQEFWYNPKATELSESATLKQPYINHAWTYACATTIGRNVSQLKFQLVDKVSKEPVEDPYGLLAFLEQPNSFQTRTEFLQSIVYALLLRESESGAGGSCFIVPSVIGEDAAYDLMQGKRIPDQLIPFNKSYVTGAVVSGSGWNQYLSGWNFQIPSMPDSKKVFKRYEIMRTYLVNPYSMIDSVSPMSPAVAPFVVDVKSDIYNAALFGNSASPSGILKTEQLLSRDQRKDLKSAWDEEYRGASNTGKTAILSKGLEYQRIALTQQEMQYKESKEWALQQMIAVFGINKIALGMYESLNYATIKEGRRMLWQDCYMPLALSILNTLNAQWIKYLYPTSELRYDTSGIDALQPEYKTAAESAGIMVGQMKIPATMAMRLNKIPYTEQDVQNYPWLDEKPQGNSLFPSGTEGTTGEAPAKAVKALTPAKQRFADDFISKVFDPGEKDMRQKLERFFNSQRNRMQDAVDEWASKQKALPAVFTSKSVASLDPKDFLFDIEKESVALSKLLKPVMKSQLFRVEAQLEDELGGLVNWGVKDELIDKFAARRVDEYVQINTTTFNNSHNEIKQAIETSVRDNETVAQAAKRIKTAIGDAVDLRKNQSTMIARTEIGIITGEARADAFRAEGVEYWEWISAGDENVRDSHIAAEEEGPVRVGTPFKANGLRYPGDTATNDPSEIINCRCVMVHGTKED